jgi:CheY-like chemotaxis protein
MGAIMFSSFGASGSFFVMPVCFHPTTAIVVDDDANFSKTLSLYLSDKLSILPFVSTDLAIDYVKNKLHHTMFTSRCLTNTAQSQQLNFSAIRHEVYNVNRFKEILMSIVDYDMPNKNGLELINTMQFPPEVLFNAYIMLSGSIVSETDPRIAGESIAKSFISKADPDFAEKLLSMVKDKCESIFQWYSYIPARLLANDPAEKTSFLFDKNCVQLLDEYVTQHNICEMYLFDKQGSYLFLDKDANLSWMFVRSELGIENTIKMATQYHAPQSVIEALKKREVILSLYEKEDFERIKTIHWDHYLLPAKTFTSSNKYVEQLGIKSQSTYYYAFSNEFVEHGIDKTRILSYQTFLDENS